VLKYTKNSRFTVILLKFCELHKAIRTFSKVINIFLECSMKVTRFTEKIVQGLKVKDSTKQSEYIDTSFPVGSFGVRVYRSGKRFYFLRYNAPSGKPQRANIGNAAIVSLREAREKALVVMGAVYQGLDPLDAKRTKGAQMTVKDLAHEFLNRYAINHYRTITVANYRGVIKKHIIPAFGSYKINAITAGTINSYKLTCDCSSHQWKAICIILSSMFRYALQNGLVDFSPCYGGQLINYKRVARNRVLSDEEIITFWQGCDVFNNSHFKVFFRVLLLTALRSAELFNTLRKDVSHGTIRIAPELAKTGKEFILPIPTQIEKMIASLPQRNDGRLFPPLSTVARKRSHYFNLIRSEMGNDSSDISMHDLRRTCATNLERLGFDNDAIAAVLGHNKALRHGGVTYCYTYYTFRTEKLEALNAWSRRVFDLVEGRVKPLPLYASLKELRQQREHLLSQSNQQS
jgi:integrase